MDHCGEYFANGFVGVGERVEEISRILLLSIDVLCSYGIDNMGFLRSFPYIQRKSPGTVDDFRSILHIDEFGDILGNQREVQTEWNVMLLCFFIANSRWNVDGGVYSRYLYNSLHLPYYR